jgi:uncharacterized protein (DUF111 family)
MTGKYQHLHIHLDLVGGIAGDMFISAMLDMFEYLQPEVLSAVALLLPSEVGVPKLSKGLNLGISGLRFCLEPKATNQSAASKITQATGRQSDKHSHTHTHSHETRHSHSHDHGHETTYRALCQRLADSVLDKAVIDVATELLTIIGKAEAKIHDKTLDDVHFHELADWDSLMDVVASAVILNSLADCSWSLSKLPLGGGLVQTQHGLIPIPAPATADILINFEFINDGILGERITPTGAAILRFLKDKNALTTQPQGELTSTGYGLGTKIFPNMPNILRAMSFDDHQSQQEQQDAVVLIEFDIDDMTSEELALSLDILRSKQGVLDVVVQTARGKKNRATELVRLMASPKYHQSIVDHCFIQTSTIGLRFRFESRILLSRELHMINDYSVKSVMRPNREQTLKIEHDNLVCDSTLKERRALKFQIESSYNQGDK